MKSLGLLGLLIVLGVAGWLMWGGPGHENSPIGGGELAQASRAQEMEDKARNAVAVADLSSLRSAVDAFQAAQGRLPHDLGELQGAGYIQTVPAGVNYDPSTGRLSPAQ